MTSPALFDVAAATAREIGRLEAEVRSAPDFIEPIVYLACALEANNRCDDALTVVEKAVARASGPTSEKSPFRDIGQNLTWLLNQRERALECVGREDEALQRRIRAARLTENGSSNTSQALNLAGTFVETAKPTEALQVLDAVGPMSNYGKAALVRVGDTDAAADVLIGRLEDLSSRVEALESLQRYGEGATDNAESPGGMAARDDIRAVIERVGRIESYPYLRWSGWIGY